MQKTMLAAVYHGFEDLRLEERPIPKLQDPRDAIVKVTLSTIVPVTCIYCMERFRGLCRGPYWGMNLSERSLLLEKV